VLKFWHNPEFVRHRRAELRPARAATVGLVVLMVCALLGLACWSERQSALQMAEHNATRLGGEWTRIAEHARANNLRLTWLLFCQWLFGLQAGFIPLWSLFMCAQSVSGERDHKTWDFQRTTSLTATELAIGKLVGEPILGYFGVLCALPFTFVAGLGAGFTVWNLLNAITGLIAGTLFMGVCGLWLSILIENRSRSIGVVTTAGIYALVLAAYGFVESWFPGMAGFSPFLNLHRILGLNFENKGYVAPTLFGHVVPWLLMSLLLYGSFGAWLWWIVVRNLKRDYAEIRQLSRWQAVGCAAFLNFVLYALFSTRNFQVKSESLASVIVAMNGIILFGIGLASLTPPERLKVWWRARAEGTANLFSEDGLPWPWLALSAAAAYGLMVWGLLAWRGALEFHIGSLREGAWQLLIVLIFITRDILFIQWCSLTRLRQPVLKGILFLCLYYAGAGVVAALASISSDASGMAAMNLLAPWGIFDPRSQWIHSTISSYGGLALQAGIIAVILVAISNRLGRPSLVPALNEG
jgi:hypothetical protein